MISQLEGTKLIESEFPELDRLYKRNSLSSDIYNSVQRLLDFSKEAVLDYNLNLSRKCFDLAKRLYNQGDLIIRSAIEKSFISSFSTFLQKDEVEKKRLKFFIPDDFYSIYLKELDNSLALREGNVLDYSNIQNITVRMATCDDAKYAKQITDEMESSAIMRGCGISKRTPSSIIKKMKEGKAVIALTTENEWVGFSYIEVWQNREFVSNSGLIVSPAYRKCGVAKAIKEKIFDLSRQRFPNAKIFSITTGLAVMKMNSKLGFETVTYSEITTEKKFWEGCKSCVNYNALQSKGCKNCFCTAMLYTPVIQKQFSDN
ncbi:hypothetical protein L0657_23115 [Dyadobacter sp. CY345]|uniref:DUF7674 family protein n=1 Tax=Dyadobacter sp. CY345 TaxID=2909335 RepID=UPI001F39A583|nr:hypothetical protein [Dyadobacter sp. CY345]MCF2446866.1 hypothetical protein [Dyadobacter sp. CY345]